MHDHDRACSPRSLTGVTMIRVNNGAKHGHPVVKRNGAGAQPKPSRRRPTKQRLTAKQLAAAEKAARAAELKLIQLGPGHFRWLD